MSDSGTQAPEPMGLYPYTKRVGNLLFVSGVGPRVRGSKVIPGVTMNSVGEVISHDIVAQCHSVFHNVRVILEEAGSSWDKIVDVTVFLTHMESDFKKYNEVYAEYFKDVQPTRTTLGITALPSPINIELKVIATID